MARQVIIVDDEKDIRDSLAVVLREEGFTTTGAESGEEALTLFETNDFDVALCDVRMPGIDGIDLLTRIVGRSPQTGVIMMTAYAAVDSAIAALRNGALDYLVKPIDFEELLVRIRRVMRYRQALYENSILRRQIHGDFSFENIIGKSRQMQEVFRLIKKVSQVKGNVLISGRSGTGKELVARAIHYHSDRRDSIFLPVNCGAISDTLIESELFGYKKGAFTGAYQDKEGMFRIADGGTLFLDEIAEIPLHLQVKLLRAIEEKEIIPVGAARSQTVDVRIISATNKVLADKVATGEFREDLYYRLNVVEIKLPPLTERKEDIPLLVQHFIHKYNVELGKSITGVDNETMRVFLSHAWRGGVRELENVIERASIFAEDSVIRMHDLPGNFSIRTSDDLDSEDLREAMRYYERKHIIEVLRRTQTKEGAAKRLNIGLSSLYRKLEEHRIQPEEFVIGERK